MCAKSLISLALPLALLLLMADGFSEKRPAHYCFVNPPAKTELDPYLLQKITTCTHLVYGRIAFDSNGHPEYKSSDHGNNDDFDNIRTFLRMRSQHPKAKFLLGLVRSQRFEDTPDAIQRAEYIKKHVLSKRFDGAFVSFDGDHLDSFSSTQFVRTLAEDNNFFVTFSITANRVFAYRAIDQLREIRDVTNHIFLDMGQVQSNEDPFVITQINSIFKNSTTLTNDTLEGTFEELFNGGFIPTDLVIGLNAGGWKFEIKDTENRFKVMHGQLADKRGEQITYQDACQQRGAVRFDTTVMNEITIFRQSWISVNAPIEGGLGEKIKWILREKFRGIGLMDALTDDPEGVCGTDPLPAHQLVKKLIQKGAPDHAARCNRLCYLNPEEVSGFFALGNLEANHCSHIVVNYFALDSINNIKVPYKAERLVKKMNSWRRHRSKAAPKLFLSVGSNQTSETWRSVIGVDFRRKAVAESLLQSLKSTSADGLEISWTLEPMDSDFDKNTLKSLIDDLGAADVEKKYALIVAVSPQSSYSNHYDYDHLNKTTSFIVLHSHRLHSESASLTGHPSPLYATSSMKDPRMSWDSLYNHWIENNVTRSKIVLSLTASLLSMQSVANVRSLEQDPFGQPALDSMLRSRDFDFRDQDGICSFLEEGKGEAHWVEEAEVPYLRRYDQMVLYENVRSSHIKAVWASMKGAGLAIHNINNDDGFALCDKKTAFPILESVARAQVCLDQTKCAQNHHFALNCIFRLETTRSLLNFHGVPHNLCTVMIVEQAKLDLGGRITFKYPQEQILKNLTETRPQELKCGIILSLYCGDSEDHTQFNYILRDHMDSAVDNLINIMKNYNFSGVQFDCENVIRRGNHVLFYNFLQKLEKKFESTKATDECNKTLSARFSHHTWNPTDYYSISLLNRLSHVSIRMTDKNGVDVPFFVNQSDSTIPSTEQTVNLWKYVGLKPEKMVLELSPFGFQQGEKEVEKRRMTQGEVCETVGNQAVYKQNYEILTGSTQHSNGTVHIPMIEDFRYKIGYARREQLGGIGFTLNGDDYTGVCGRGFYPVLKSLHSSIKCH